MTKGAVMDLASRPPDRPSLRARASRVAHSTLLPLAAIGLCPLAVLVVWYVHTELGGSLAAFGSLVAREGVAGTARRVVGPVALGSAPAWAMLAAFVAFEIALLRAFPSRRVEGPPTPSGDVPTYADDGLLAFAATLGAFVLGSWGLGLFPATIVYDHFGELLGALNLVSLALCAALYVKGRVAPSSRDAGTSGNPIFDFYWGVELHPRVLGVNVKQLTNCRLGMMAWPIVLLSFAAAQEARYGYVADSMIVAVALQLLKVTKFFSWERGYFFSLDVMHDRAGFYICWGCLVWVPAIYTASTLYLVAHPIHLGAGLSALIFAGGAIAIGASTLADRERRRVRDSNGATTVWRRPPALIRAPYVDDRGVRRENLLLASGFWGVARHFHYVPEVLSAVFWTLPVGFAHALPWLYVPYITLLLVHRALRDDARCAAKYGSAWDEYRRRVPYRIVPGVF